MLLLNVTPKNVTTFNPGKRGTFLVAFNLIIKYGYVKIILVDSRKILYNCYILRMTVGKNFENVP